MKKMKKLTSLLLAFVLAMGMASTAFAAPDTTTPHKITITNETKNHVYEAYQVFKGDNSNEDDKLVDLGWGSGVDGAALLAELKTLDAYKDCSDAEDVADVLAGFEDNSAQIDAFAKVVAKHLTATVAGTSTQTESPYEIAVTGDGYYFVKDKDNSAIAQGDTYTKYILKVVEDVEVAAKDGTVTSEKKVFDINDSTTVKPEVIPPEGWQDSADYDIGDVIPFKLKATLPENFTSYKTYQLTFHDKESAGLVFGGADTVVVKINGTQITSGFEVVTTELKDDCTFEVRFAELVGKEGVTNNSEITVEYTSTLTGENVVIGNPGNPNEMYVTFSNNPNNEQAGKPGEEPGRTPDDVVVVFTYETIVDKVDDNGDALPGAVFTLEKYNKEANAWEAVDQVETTPGTTFTFRGLDDGQYRLTETEVPEGYNSIDPITFTVTATHTVEQIDGKDIVIETLTIDPEDLFSAAVNTGTFEKKDGTDKTLTSGQIYTEIVNKAGTVLPETGGIGTTLFYVIGTILVLGAGVLLVTKKRMDEK